MVHVALNTPVFIEHAKLSVKAGSEAEPEKEPLSGKPLPEKSKTSS